MNVQGSILSTPFPTPTLALATSPSPENRAQAYEFLAGIFLKEPSAEILSELKTWAGINADGESQVLLAQIAQEDPLLDNLKQEYYDLFFVPVSGRFVPPFESAIISASRKEGKKTKFGSFWGLETTKVSDFYARAEFRPEQLTVFEPLRQINLPDHIGFELSFMAYLCRWQAQQKNRGLSTSEILRVQTSFLTRHLNRWLPLFVNDLGHTQQSGYYPYFAKIAQELCAQEVSDLEP